MRVINPGSVKNLQYYFIGAVLIILNKIRHYLFSYSTPRTFPASQINWAVEYDTSVVQKWIHHFNSYTKEKVPLRNKTVLELGPGADLGTGLILLAMGAAKYIAIDTFGLAGAAPEKFYEKLLRHLKEKYPDCDTDYLKEELNKCYRGKESRIEYIVDKKFRISAVKDKIDIVFSQAAFEHFSEIERVFKETSDIARRGAILVAEVDLKTHTRWIRDKDPLSIYRYNDFFWNIFQFKGSPNRVRTSEYKDLLEKMGWSDIKIELLETLEDSYLEKVIPTLHKKFRNKKASEMKILSFMLMARKEAS